MITFDFADRWLFEGKFLAQLNLRDSGPMTNLDQQFQEDGIVPRMDALTHHVKWSINSKFEYSKLDYCCNSRGRLAKRSTMASSATSAAARA